MSSGVNVKKSSIYNRIMAHDCYVTDCSSHLVSCFKCGADVEAVGMEEHWCFMTKAERKARAYDARTDEKHDEGR